MNEAENAPKPSRRHAQGPLKTFTDEQVKEFGTIIRREKGAPPPPEEGPVPTNITVDRILAKLLAKAHQRKEQRNEDGFYQQLLDNPGRTIRGFIGQIDEREERGIRRRPHSVSVVYGAEGSTRHADTYLLGERPKREL